MKKNIRITILLFIGLTCIGVKTIVSLGQVELLAIELSIVQAPSGAPNYVNVVWKTATEILVRDFQVFKSGDGVNFIPSGTIVNTQCPNNCYSIKTYSFLDLNTVFGTNYYKLITTFLDGSTKTSGIVNTSNKNTKCDMYGIYLFNYPTCPVDDLILVWEDNFNGSTLDLSKWQLQDWGQGALQGGANLEVNTLNNVTVSDGICTITARKELVQMKAVEFESPDKIMADGLPNLRTYNYTSSNIWTKYKFFQGKFEARVKLPSGVGLWPAFWTFGGTRWNEIDIFDNYSGDNNLVTNIHHDYDGDGNSEECSRVFNNAFDNSKWHIFTCVFDFDRITWEIDGNAIRIIPRVVTEAHNIRLYIS